MAGRRVWYNVPRGAALCARGSRNRLDLEAGDEVNLFVKVVNVLPVKAEMGLRAEVITVLGADPNDALGMTLYAFRQRQ